MRTLRSADIVSGIFICLLGVAVTIAAMNIPALMGERLPSKALPLLCGVLTAIGGVLLVVRAINYKGEEIPVDWPAADGWRHIIVTLVALVVYIAVINLLGLPVASMVFVAVLVPYLGMSVLAGILSGLGTAVFIYLMIHYLSLSFPLGVLGS
ncbi:tripartite tricarboxylate transporter TctB family protein [Nitratidesulfovibrio sp. SRB-5]|uniref:tripartite tricarboxylate transporter TctB family protein n=1 Tax=Nitratidesulfovibrio sp. SRB-5 TaxID=2872636 RepID=UPI00167E1A7C|nr:tripartite tricarboxylate transporter TctB family protein [Nitratidesulfovibrio sp. SRB-5]MBZ2173378.1 tripartite tricarboxylate transporter TctB family protein [Nitratidesulfovibrio sp. SRB-5]